MTLTQLTRNGVQLSVAQDDKHAADATRARALTASFAAEYPFTPHFFETPHGTQHYLDEGPKDAAPLLAVHGNPSWSFLYRHLAFGLRAKTRVIAPDHLGCGLSDKPQDAPYRLADHIERLCALVEFLDLTCITLCVHDWGGAIGMGFAQRMPERLSRLIILNSAAFTPFPEGPIPARIAVCRTPTLGPVLMRGLNAFARAAGRMATVRSLSAPVRRGFIAPYANWSERVALDQFLRDIPNSPSHPTHATLAAIEAGLPSLTHLPAMIIWGERDWCFTPAFRRRWQEAFPDACAHVVEDAGHWVLEDAHEQALPWIREFLQTSE